MKPEPNVGWYDDAHPPTGSGLYYWESCDDWGNPRPGFYLWEDGKPPQLPDEPWKMFGPIRGAMQPWPMTAAAEVTGTSHVVQPKE